MKNAFAGVLVTLCFACSGVDGAGGSEEVGEISQPLTGAPWSFEDLSDWAPIVGSAPTLSNQANAGAHAFALAGGYSEIQSAPGGAGGITSQVTLAVKLPAQLPNPHWVGGAQVLVTIPSRNVYRRPLPYVAFDASKAGVYQQLTFAVPSDIQPMLASAPDVSWIVAFNAPASSTPYLLDGPGGGTTDTRHSIVAVYLRPSDLPHRQAYYDAMVETMTAARSWYQAHAGITFKEPEFRTVVGPSYLTMRCGSVPDAACAGDLSKIPMWASSVEAAVGGYPSRQVTVVFSEGGGGYAGGAVQGTYAGFAITGDWVLGPITGIMEPNTHNCAVAGSAGAPYCTKNAAIGTVVHEMGHAFGLFHPNVAQPTIMSDHTAWPNTSMLDYEIKALGLSPVFVSGVESPNGPWINFSNFNWQVVVAPGSTLTLYGTNLLGTDRVEFLSGVQSIYVTPTNVTLGSLTVTVPSNATAGYVRAHRGTVPGNSVPVNIW